MNERSKQLRRDTIKLSKANGGYHFGGCFSCVEILIALYDHILKPDDVFILSKGHACWPYYVLLHERGCTPRLEGHPTRDVANGVHWTTGSEGHGLPAAIGMALARRLQGKLGKMYVLVGDGECQEGTTWEGLLMAPQHHLDNLTVIVDRNGIQGSGFTDKILSIEALDSAAEAAGWHTVICDGHDVEKLVRVLAPYCMVPRLVIANTVKGCGVSFMENRPEWHAHWLSDSDEQKALEELA